MENYVGTSGTLSAEHVETTDNLIASAIKTVPKSAIAAILPVVKTKGPTSQWVEPWFAEDKLELLSSPISMFIDDNSRRNLRFSCNAVEDIARMYTPEAFTSTVHGWVLFHKNKRQRAELIKLLRTPDIANVPADASIPSLRDPLSDDNSKIIQTRVLQVINDLKKDFQLGDTHFSVVAPYEMGYALTQLSLALGHKLHILYDDEVTKMYIFPTGEGDLSRAGIGLFEYADEVQKAVDPETGDLAYWIYNRSMLAINPVHKKNPIVRNLELL